jgi:hypothetical protein
MSLLLFGVFKLANGVKASKKFAKLSVEFLNYNSSFGEEGYLNYLFSLVVILLLKSILLNKFIIRKNKIKI